MPSPVSALDDTLVDNEFTGRIHWAPTDIEGRGEDLDHLITAIE